MKYIIILKLKSVCLINVFVFQLNDQTEANRKSDLPYGGLHLTDDDINFIDSQQLIDAIYLVSFFLFQISLNSSRIRIKNTHFFF